MSEDLKSLHELFPRRWPVPAMLSMSAAFLILGLFLPVITLKELIFWKTTFSVISGIESLFLEKHYVLALIILFFSVFFPIVKLSFLFFLWFFRTSQAAKDRIIDGLGSLGKWSMLDVFVVALMIIITKISHFASARPRIGIYFFGVSIALAMIATEHINRLLKRSVAPPAPAGPQPNTDTVA